MTLPKKSGLVASVVVRVVFSQIEDVLHEEMGLFCIDDEELGGQVQNLMFHDSLL